jgi:hypothetical protein
MRMLTNASGRKSAKPCKPRVFPAAAKRGSAAVLVAATGPPAGEVCRASPPGGAESGVGQPRAIFSSAAAIPGDLSA